MMKFLIVLSFGLVGVVLNSLATIEYVAECSFSA